jgi:antitoxin (DNA-binding transcriptional repressor) of toxin-antitoxin stability system
VVDEDIDVFGAEAAAALLVERIEQGQPVAVRVAGDGRALLSPPFATPRDRVAGPGTAQSTLVVFGAFGTPSSRPLGHLMDHVRQHHVDTVRLAWRHYPNPAAHPRAAILALAAEAAASLRKFWVPARELLALRHDDPAGERYSGELNPAELSAALEAAQPPA